MKLETNRFMEFRLSAQLFAVPLKNVREVLQRPEVTMIPNMPSYFEGMMNLRGQIIGIFSARKKLIVGSDKLPAAEAPVVIVLEAEGITLGLVVDEVTRVISPKDDEISAAPIRTSDAASLAISNVLKIDNNLIVALNVGELLGIEQIKHKLVA